MSLKLRQELKMSLVWSVCNNGSYVKGATQDFIMEDKAAIFDLDHTLIKPLSGERTFSLKPDDWTWCFDTVKSKIQSLYRDNFSIVIITNQLHLVGGTGIRYSWFKEKMSNVIRELKVPVLLLVSVKKDENRKPSPDLWFEYKNEIDMDKSFYCGDAAGREQDFSDSDAEFAVRAGGIFHLPETIFSNPDSNMLAIK